MKASQAKPLSGEELKTLQSLFQRWVLCSYPYYDGSSEQSDAIQTYDGIAHDAKRGKMRCSDYDEDRRQEVRERMEEEGETEL